MSSSVIAGLRALGPALSPALARVADYVLARPQAVLSQTITELAAEAGSSEASVIRLCREQGFEGFQRFKLALASELAAAEAREIAERPRGAVGDLVAAGAQALHETEALLDRAVVANVAARLAAARRILLYGAGASAVTVAYAAFKLIRLGMPACVVDDPHLAAMHAVSAGRGDVVLLVSSSGSTVDTVRTAAIARRAGAFVAVITNRTRSPLANHADAVLVAAWPETPLQGGAFASKIGQLLIVEVLQARLATDFPDLAPAVHRTAESVSDRSY